jgi:hypothetical protein
MEKKAMIDTSPQANIALDVAFIVNVLSVFSNIDYEKFNELSSQIFVIKSSLGTLTQKIGTN